MDYTDATNAANTAMARHAAIGRGVVVHDVHRKKWPVIPTELVNVLRDAKGTSARTNRINEEFLETLDEERELEVGRRAPSPGSSKLNEKPAPERVDACLFRDSRARSASFEAPVLGGAPCKLKVVILFRGSRCPPQGRRDQASVAAPPAAQCHTVALSATPSGSAANVFPALRRHFPHAGEDRPVSTCSVRDYKTSGGR